MPVKNIKQSTIENIAWPVQNVQAIQTTRLSPFLSKHNSNSSSVYQEFNLATHVEDSFENVLVNRQRLKILLPNKSKIQWLEQVHGDIVIEIHQQTETPLVADAVITKQKNITLAIMTADCLPILLSDKKGNEIAAIHGGWRPLAKKIINKTIVKMQSSVEDIHAWLGPCIGKNAFEVGEEVYFTFVKQNKNFKQAFIEIISNKESENEEKKYFADLHLIARLQLQNLGVTNISTLAECTYTMNSKYYSYRKQKHTGRMATLISRC